jgi:hypothetical protein
MKNDQERRAHSETSQYATPKPPLVMPRLCLIVFGHGATLLPLYLRAKGKCRRQTRTACETFWQDLFEADAARVLVTHAN